MKSCLLVLEKICDEKVIQNMEFASSILEIEIDNIKVKDWLKFEPNYFKLYIQNLNPLEKRRLLKILKSYVGFLE